jgi:hypothetical protein
MATRSWGKKADIQPLQTLAVVAVVGAAAVAVNWTKASAGCLRAVISPGSDAIIKQLLWQLTAIS